MTAILTLILLIPAAEPESARVLLDKMIASRKSFATADLRWTLETRKASKMYRRSRYDRKNWTFEEVGDCDGVVRPDQLGSVEACSTIHFLAIGDQRWRTHDNSPIAAVWDLTAPHRKQAPPFPMMDGRIIGLWPEYSIKDLEGILPALLNGVRDENLRVRDAGDGISEVSIKERLTTRTWWLDTRKNYNPVRIERRDRSGKLLTSVKSELAFYDDHVWFPKRVEYMAIKEGEPTTTVIEIEVAEFDRPNHPPLLSPAHIGVVPYNQVNWQTRGANGEHRDVSVWNGSQIVKLDDVMEKKKDGTLTDADFALWLQKSTPTGDRDDCRWPTWMKDPMYGVGKPSDVDAWETYVRRFCLIRKCDDRQKASAKSILDDCRKTAVPLLARIKDEQKKESDAARKEAMLAPIDDIFTNRLVPRLESLLTTSQSLPASPASTSRPAAPAVPVSPKP